MRNIFTRLWVVSLLLLVTATVSAQLTSLEVDKVYRFVNARTAGRSLNGCGSGNVNTTTTDATDLKQQWYVTKDGDYYVLRNLYYAQYLKGTEEFYTAWTMTDDYSATQNKFELVTSNSTLNTLKIKGSDTSGHMHDSNNEGHYDGCSVVKWYNNDSGSYWTIHEVTYSNEELKTILDAHPTVAEVAARITNFHTFFTDDACTTPSYATLELAKAAAEYGLLSADLQALVDEIYTKVLSDNWEEDNAVDGKDSWGSEYAKKFRVQMYEPYSIANDITKWLGINYHANNDNPTGIYMPAAGTLYVMVEGTIKEGASLRIIDAGTNGRIITATTSGQELTNGVNVINYTGATGMLYICYNVDTYKPEGTDDATRFPHKISEYKPLKIHIEGGAITGYYNAIGDFRAADTETDDLWDGVDNDADWTYLEDRANLSVLPVLGHRQILLFQLEDNGDSPGMRSWLPDNINIPATPYNRTKSWDDYTGMGLTETGTNVNKMIEAWDRIMYSELATMGLLSEAQMQAMNTHYPRQNADGSVAGGIYEYDKEINNQTYLEFTGVDYAELFNHHGVALGTESGYMYGSGDHCGYNISTFNGIVRDIASTAGSTWGPAHEIGHQHQALLTLNGLTEVTNNLFSNIALWYKGLSTSRYNSDNGSLESVLNAYNTENSDIYTNNIWALTHLYYRLWLYYHLAGNNTQFYPRLFELLRHDPMQKGYYVSGDVSTLHFYKLACEAAGEDLTEFFRAHGYFSIMDNRLVGDYSNSEYTVTEQMIKDAIAEVKAKDYKENLSVIFICDDIVSETIDGTKYAAHYQHDGTTLREMYDGTTPNSDLGAVSDFISGNTEVNGTYTATMNDDGTITMSGATGGVGFLILNEDEELVSFSNKTTFELSAEAAYLVATGKATIVTVDSNSEMQNVAVDVSHTRYALLQDLIVKANALIDNVSEIRVGFYKPSAVTNLSTYIEQAENVIATADYKSLQAVYELLYAEYNAVVANEFSRVTLVPGSKYAIISVKSDDRILTYSGSNVTTVPGNADAYSSTDAYQWYIERDGAYYIKNAGTSKYIQDVTDQNGELYTVGDNKVNMNINEVALGCYTIATSNVPGRYMNMDGANAARIITWGDAYSENSQWAFILLDVDDTNAAKEELLELSKKTLALVNEVATVSYNEGSKISLQSDDENAANYIWSNAAVSDNDVDKLLDSDINTFFHSQWNNSTAPDDGWGHHISVDLGTSSTLTSFKFNFTTRNASNLSNYPKTIEVYGSDDNSTYTKLQVASGFATGAGVNNEALVMGNGTAYRYLRFLVTDATGNNAGTNTGSDGMVFFHMAEFSLYPITVSAEIKSEYTNSTITTDDVLAAYIDAEEAYSIYINSSATIDVVTEKQAGIYNENVSPATGTYATLLSKYDTFIESGIEDKKQQLQDLINQTKDLLATVGSVGYVDEVLELTTENLYCNDYHIGNGDDDSENYVEKLTDGDHTTYLHTDWNNTNSNGTTPHYLRVDMGEGVTITKFKFNYVTRKNGDNCPTGIVVEGSNDADGTYKEIDTLTKDDNDLPTDYSQEGFESETIASVPYRYIRFRVSATESGALYFVMSEFGFTKIDLPVVTMINVDTSADEELVYNTYIATAKSQKLHDAETTSAELIDVAIADQQAVYDALDKAIKTPADLDKSGLEELVALAQPLYNKMATDGVVNVDYAPSALTNAQLTAASDALAAANEALASATSQAALDEAKATLQTAYDALLAVENANEKNTLATTDLVTLIEQVETLLGTIATTGTSKGEIALQVGDANSEFYIWSNAPASDCNDYSHKVEGLIDVNEDGSANTGTFFGTAWGAAVAAYTHYLEVDLGVATSINKFSMDYTTRASGYANQRPTAIKILGSNNKVDYAEVTTIEEGLATGECEQWAMETPLELGARYRYIRFAVATQETTGYFNMSDFNLYSISDKVLNDYYSTADADLNALLLALEVANDALSRHYLTTAQYTAIKDKLNSVYNDVNNVIALDYTTRDGLTTLITNTETLINKVATVNGYAKAVQLQCNDASAPNYLYCNAPGGSNNYDTDKAGVAALIDLVDGEPNLSTFIHTTYYGDDYDDDLDHYLRVDAGEGKSILAFKFNYNCRQGYGSNSPKVILIEGTNDLNEEFEEITTLSDLPTDNNASYESALISNGKPYRYIRFMVKETGNDNSHPFFSMSHFGMSSCIDASISEDYPKVTPELLLNAYLEKNSATEAKNHYMPEADYTAAQEALQAAYDALNAASKADKTALVELIEATEVLEKQLYKIDSYDKQEITLSATPGELGYIYCNAPENNVTAANDMLGVSALIDKTGDDPEYDTYLHTDYNDDDSEDGLDHYLRVDLGTDAAKAYVEFEYRGRSGAANLTPDIIVVEATNDLDSNDWTKITTLKGLAETTIQDVASGCLGNGVAYRYWRFMVTKTHNNNSKKESAGHPFFALSNFKLYECTNVERSEQLKYSPTIYIYTTTDLVTEVDGAINAAAEVKDNADATQATVDAEVKALQAVYDKLEEALKYADVPVAITTDINSPKLYVIYSQRGDTENNSVWTQTLAKCWQYNFANKNITINNYDSESLYHLWYFTYDDDYDCYGIVPVMTPAYPMGSNNIGEAANRVFSVSLDDADGYVTLWSLSKSAATATDGVYYNFKPFGYNTYLSNIYGGSNALGFYGSEDGGSRVYFKSVEVEDLAFKRLSKLNEVMGTLGITPAASEIVGEYTMASATTYSEAVETATSMVEGGASTETEYNEQFVALYQSYENLAINLPVPGTLYTLRSKYRENHYAFVNDDRVARYSNNHIGDDKIDADAIWVFEGTENGSLKLKNLQTGCYVPSLPNKGFSLVADSESAGAVTLHPYGEGDGSLQIQSGSYYFHFNDGTGADQKLIGWEAGGIGGGNPVYIEEVDVEEAIKKISHSVTLAANTTGNETIKKYSTLCLGYPVTLPAESDVKAYIASGIDDNNVIELLPVANDGKTIPANTPVILKSDSGVASVTATFTADAVSSVDETTNLLGGSNYTTYVSCLNEQGENVANVYMLTRKNGLIAMRWMYENYKLENGAYTQVENTASDDGGYVKCPANKAYLKLDAATSNLSTEYYFGFFGGATDIDEVNTEENPLDGTIFDLQGRKIEEVTVPGFYIVNGEKMYVDTDMLK